MHPSFSEIATHCISQDLHQNRGLSYKTWKKYSGIEVSVLSVSFLTRIMDWGIIEEELVDGVQR